MKRKFLYNLLVLSLFIQSAFSQLAFPGSEGFGSESRHAYQTEAEPKILKVTSLKEYGPNTLRWAISQDYPRIIVFDVSGIIHLSRDLYIRNPYLFIAGQSAPFPGITITNGTLFIRSHNILIQGLKLRYGVQTDRKQDCISIGSARNSTYNIIVDHCSVSWGLDENIGIAGTHYGITVSNCIISEGIDTKNGNAYGLLAYDNGELSILKNLFIHNSDRNPLIKGESEKSLVYNNLIYNSDTHCIYFGHKEEGNSKFEISAINNYYIQGEHNRNSNIITFSDRISSNAKAFLAGNIVENRIRKQWERGYTFNPVGSSIIASKPLFEHPHTNIIPTSEIKTLVLNNCGAFPFNRDSIDDRLINEVITKTGKRIRTPDEVGGFVKSNNTHHLTIPNKAHEDEDKNGFTNIEEWLNELLFIKEIP